MSTAMSLLVNSFTANKPVFVEDLAPVLNAKIHVTAERFQGTEFAPPHDPKQQVLSKDVVYCPNANLSCRIYLPKNTKPGQKLPLLVYYHGGGFIVETAFSPTYHNYLNQLVAKVNVIAVSVDYRLAPEFPLPIAFDDCWTALNWIASNSVGHGEEIWLKSHADFGNVFMAGDSAGATIAYNMGRRFHKTKLPGIRISGIILVHPYFWGVEPVENETTDPIIRGRLKTQWRWVCPKSSGLDDPLFNPFTDPNFGKLCCTKVLVFVAGNDFLRYRGHHIYTELNKCGWEGRVEFMESENENHVFHLSKNECEHALQMLDKIEYFISYFSLNISSRL